MKYLSTLISLASVALAVDFAFHTTDTCGGSAIVCVVKDPNVCCSTGIGAPFRSISIRNISPGFNYDTMVSREPNCIGSTSFRGGCTPGEYRSVSLRALFENRAADPIVDDELECQKPNALIIADGTKYDLSTLDDAELDSLIAISFTAVSAEDIPEQFQSLQVGQ